MIRQYRELLARFAMIFIVVAAPAFVIGCATQQCKEGDNSRFRCDPTAPAVQS